MGEKTKGASGKWIAAGLLAAAAVGALAAWGIHFRYGVVPRRERMGIPRPESQPSPAGEGQKTSQEIQAKIDALSEHRTLEDLEKAVAKARASGEPYTITCNGFGPPDRYWQLTITGDRFFASGEWAEAFVSYRKAEAIRKDDLLTAKIVECRFRVALAKADQFRAEGKYDEAGKAYPEALAAKPSAKELIEARLAALAADRQYKKLMADGDVAMKREQWGAALASYQQAQKIRDTAAVRAAIGESGYQEFMKKAKEASDKGQLDKAREYMEKAKSFQDIVRWVISEKAKETGSPAAGKTSPTTDPATTMPSQAPGP